MPTLERAGMGGVLLVSGFSGNGFRVGPTVLPTGLLIWPEGAEEWTPPALVQLAPQDVGAFDKADPPLELLLLGTGAKLRRPAKSFSEALGERHIAVEPMDSKGAARTYNLLAGEGRRVGAALYPLDA